MNYKAVYKTAPATPGLLIMDHKKDSDQNSKKKCNKPDCQKSNCWYVQMTLMPTSNDVLHQQDIKRFTCKTCQNNFFGQNELVHHRKREHPSKIRCKYFLTNTCRISSDQGALGGFRHDQLQMWQMLHKVWKISRPLVERKNSPSSCHVPDPYVRTTTTNCD